MGQIAENAAIALLSAVARASRKRFGKSTLAKCGFGSLAR
jgi:hypothetical protein